jgi:hypothetical protein
LLERWRLSLQLQPKESTVDATFRRVQHSALKKLKDLSARELGYLLGLPLDKARAWLEVAASIPGESYHVRWLSDFTESSPLLRRSAVEELSELTVEEALRMKRTGELYRRFPYLKPRAPKDADTRLRYLRELLRNEPDFGARFPAAYELLYGASSTESGLLLPSFGVRVPVRVMENEPQESILPARWHQRWKDSQDGGDAFSATFEKRMRGEKDVDQAFSPLELGYMRGLLLAVLSREEYAERIATELHIDAIREKLGAPVQAPVRITDLRLAVSPRLGDANSLKEALKPQLRSLESPITAGASSSGSGTSFVRRRSQGGWRRPKTRVGT